MPCLCSSRWWRGRGLGRESNAGDLLSLSSICLHSVDDEWPNKIDEAMLVVKEENDIRAVTRVG